MSPSAWLSSPCDVLTFPDRLQLDPGMSTDITSKRTVKFSRPTFIVNPLYLHLLGQHVFVFLLNLDLFAVPLPER